MRVLLLVCFCVWVPLSCQPKAGSSCDKGEARCIDGKRELVCQAGTFVETPCRGPAGCKASEQGTSCDFSGNKPGDPCSTEEDGAAACVSRDSLLACHGGRYALVPCRGAGGCRTDGGRAACDGSLAEPGDGCREENLKACSVDGTQVLVCKLGAMQRFYQCRGQGGCASRDGKLSCDTSIAKLGDACDQKLEGRAFSCTLDKSAVLVCKSGAFALDQRCKAGQNCELSGTNTECKGAGK